jgi:hypothetical protein
MAGKEKVEKKFWETKSALVMSKKYIKGATIKALAQEYSVPIPVISQSLKMLNVAIRPRGRRVAG